MALGSHGAVSTPHLEASLAAIETLRGGGNAVDAAVVAAAVAAVVQPFSSSTGGVGWAMVHDRESGSTEVVEFLGAVPESLDTSAFVPDALGLVDWRQLESSTCPLAGALTPAVVAGWAALLDRWGRLSLAQALEPAIRCAERGFPVSELLHRNTAISRTRLARWPSSADIFLHDGEPIAIGSLLVQRDLAATLRRIATNGPIEMITGATGRAIVEFSRAHGGAIEPTDLSRIAPRWQEPLVTSYRGYEVRAAPAPYGDVAFVSGIQLLNARGPFAGPLDPEYIHVSIESAKLVAGDRARYLGPGCDAGTIEWILSKTHTDELVASLHSTAAPGQTAGLVNEDTITLATIDGDGNAVHLMQTVGTFFGTGAVVPGTGVLLNSSLYFAYANRSRANRIVPGRAVEQNPCIAMVFDDIGDLRLVAGSPGGKTRVETVRQLLANVLDFNMNVQEAVDAGRFLAAPDGSSIDFEARYGDPDRELCAELERRGHVVRTKEEAFGSGQAIAVDASSGTFMAGADWRREAVALAY